MKPTALPRSTRYTLVALATLLLSAATAQAQTYTLEGAVIDSRSAQNLGVVNERGDINSLFRAQKAMTYGILRSAGIPVESLPPEVRARVERFATNNLEAFRAFSQGLELKDQGRFVEAKEAFRRAAELDPGFLLAVEQQRSMPDVNLGSGLQTRAVIAAAAGAAVDRGKASVAVDTAQAVAALASGQSVVTVPSTSATDVAYSVNAAGKASEGPGANGANLVVGLTYGVPLSSGDTAGIATAQEWRGGAYVVADGKLVSLGNPTLGFLAERKGATDVPGGNVTLADGSLAYWGAWNSTPAASASITVKGQPTLVAPELGSVSYVLADATRVMPGSGTVTYKATGGSLTPTGGGIEVNFVTRTVTLQSLGFNIGNLAFSGLAGTASYDPTKNAAGTFGANYTGGACAGCTDFSPLDSRFGGSFVGRGADGLVFSTFMRTGPETFSAGVHLYTPPAKP